MNTYLRDILVGDLKLDPAGLRPGARIDDAGMDSLSLVELGLLLSERHGVDIGEEVLASARTVGALARIVEEHIDARGPR
ncbi:phosphopantetheine-binding protein [Streptomyces sp. NPDC088789]|uniref:phosphopantetheine-binding protein n=1 Tax=Streptomyces sp. NPDC088789 TaxID=3365899 RepID=UPI00382DCDAD